MKPIIPVDGSIQGILKSGIIVWVVGAYFTEKGIRFAANVTSGNSIGVLSQEDFGDPITPTLNSFFERALDTLKPLREIPMTESEFRTIHNAVMQLPSFSRFSECLAHHGFKCSDSP